MLFVWIVPLDKSSLFFKTFTFYFKTIKIQQLNGDFVCFSFFIYMFDVIILSTFILFRRHRKVFDFAFSLSYINDGIGRLKVENNI